MHIECKMKKINAHDVIDIYTIISVGNQLEFHN